MSSINEDRKLPPWAKQLMDVLGLEEGCGAARALESADTMATNLAPDTRRMYTWILFFQGAAVLVPIGWLLVVRHHWSASYTAYTVVLCTLLLVGISWWMRWRGMQRTWTRARMIAEIARSAKATHGVNGKPTVEALRSSPKLQAVAIWITGGEDESKESCRETRSRYLEERIEDQLKHYEFRKEKALKERRRMSRYVTMALDGALFLAVAGLVVSFNDDSERWLRLSGADLVLGFVGASLPLIAILMQLRGSYLELDRRTGRYAQQTESLEAAAETLKNSETLEEVQNSVIVTERALLTETVDWFYLVQHSQPYYRSKGAGTKVGAKQQTTARPSPTWVRRIGSGFGMSAGFVGRVFFGRILVAALSVVFTVMLVSYMSPTDWKETSRISLDDGRLLSAAGKHWVPDSDRKNNGFILIAHGLKDSVSEGGWMSKMRKEIETKLGSKAPDICLVDWSKAANPSENMKLIDAGGIESFAAIRPVGEEIGELVGYKIARALKRGDLNPTEPIHLIGHSAGGFVVIHAAMVLIDLGVAPEKMRITLLDTPVPIKEHLEAVLERFPIDFYHSSMLAMGVPESGFHPRFFREDLTPPSADIADVHEAHFYAFEWYIETIKSSEGETGFHLSPFAEGE